MRHALKTAAVAWLAGLGIALGAGVSENDRKFANEAAQAGAAEVKLSQIAQDRGASPAVKEFAKQMIDDHSKANEELKSIASKKGFTLRSDLDEEHQKTVKRLESLSGVELDREYAQVALKEHKKAVSLFKDVGTKVDDPDLQKFASKTLPTLEHHLKMAEQLAAKLVGRPSTGP